MSDDNRNSVDAARERIDRYREDGSLSDRAGNLRDLIVTNIEILLWIVLALGVLSALWYLVTLHVLTAVTTLLTTVVTVGIGFVVLDLRDDLRNR